MLLTPTQAAIPMTLTRDEAARALAEMEAAQNRSSVLARYAAGGPILMLWGAEWFVCNLVSQYGGGAANWVWPSATLVAMGLSFWLSRRAGAGARKGYRAIATSLAIFVFFFCLFSIMRLADLRAFNAVISLSVGLAYVIVGLWTGLRYAVLGAAVMAAVMAGWWLFPSLFFVWMAVVGGGALALGGLWLRRA